MRTTRSVAVALILATALLCSMVALFAPTVAQADDAVLSVSPTGSGSVCSTTDPCELAAAGKIAGPGTTIELQSGDYGVVDIRGAGGTAAQPVLIRPAVNARPTFTRLSTYLPYSSWTGVLVQLTFYIRSSAVGTTISGIHMDGGGMFVRADHTTVKDSLFENGHSIDGIQVSRATGVLLEGNTIRGYDQTGTTGYHADCVQVFDATDVTIRANSIANCNNAGIILSSGGGYGIDGVDIQSNFVQSCVVRSSTCVGGSAVDLREPSAKNVHVVNNTIIDGSTRIAATEGFVFDRNIVSYLSDCDPPLTNTIVADWNHGKCGQPTAIGEDGNREGVVDFVDRNAGDLHLSDVAEAMIAAEGGTPAATDFDGLVMPPTIAGAASGVDPGEAPVVPEPIGPSPTPTPSSTPPQTPEPSDVPTEEPSPSPAPTLWPGSTPSPDPTSAPDVGPPRRPVAWPVSVVATSDGTTVSSTISWHAGKSAHAVDVKRVLFLWSRFVFSGRQLEDGTWTFTAPEWVIEQAGAHWNVVATAADGGVSTAEVVVTPEK